MEEYNDIENVKLNNITAESNILISYINVIILKVYYYSAIAAMVVF